MELRHGIHEVDLHTQEIFLMNIGSNINSLDSIGTNDLPKGYLTICRNII